MASLVVLKRYLWLNLTELKGADKVPFVDFTVSPTGLFGPAVEGFAERFTATQKSSQAMRHFLPKHSNSVAASSRPKMAPTQQPAKAVPPAVQPAIRKRKRLRPALAGPALKKPLLYLLAPRSVPSADGIVFVKNYVVNVGSFHIAPIQSIGVIARKLKHKHFQKESTFALPLITSLGDPLGGLPLETIQHLATHAEVWQAIPGVSKWVLGIIKRGYTLQFARRPPRFGGEVSTSVQHSNAHVLHAEVMSLLAKRAVETVSPAQSFYSHYFLVPKKDGGLRPILDLKCPYEKAVQDDYIEADPLANMPKGLVLFTGSERSLLSHPDSPPLQAGEQQVK